MSLFKKIKSKFISKILDPVITHDTILPKFGFHQPLDYSIDTFPIKFEKPIYLENDPLPVPAPEDRMGYSPNDADDYILWGLEDKKLLMKYVHKYLNKKDNLNILDFGCSSGRVLRHFYPELKYNWKLYGVDIQARPIQWIREFMPKDFRVYTGTTIPSLPFPDHYFDFIYGFSIFTHIKYNWDMWLLEIRRVLKPGGLLIQTVHTENAWSFYYKHQNYEWVKKNHSHEMLKTKDMPYDYFYYGDITVSQVFWKTKTVESYWGRYFDNVTVLPPPKFRSFQDWVICR